MKDLNQTLNITNPIYILIMVSEKGEELGNTGIYISDLVRISNNKRARPKKSKWQRHLEQNADVIKRALDALEEKEKRDQELGV